MADPGEDPGADARGEGAVFSPAEAGSEGPPREPGDPAAGREPQRAGLLGRWAASGIRLGAAMSLAGAVGVFLRELGPLQQLVIGAPVFEELLKLGVPLLLASLVGLSPRLLRFALAAAAGAGFGLLEHEVTYPQEGVLLFRSRLAFHASAAALSMAAYDAVAPLPDVRTRWLATLPATVYHAANNVGALVFGVLGVAGLPIGDSAVRWSTLLAVLTALSALLALAARRPVRRALGGIWAWVSARGLDATGPR